MLLLLLIKQRNFFYEYESRQCFDRDKWVPVNTEWCVLSLRIEERLPIRRVPANILNNRKRTADKGWSFSLDVGRGVDKPSLIKLALLQKMNTWVGPGLILLYDLSNGKGT